jgi:hypothetical protein
MDAPIVDHPALGRIAWDGRVDCWWTRVELTPGCVIELHLVPEPDRAHADLRQFFEAGAAYLEWARTSEPRVRGWVADSVLDLYNGWYSEEDPAAGRPPMDRATFLAHIRPCGISFHADGSAAWGYACGDLLSGQEVWLPLGPDGGFAEGTASLLGWHTS